MLFSSFVVINNYVFPPVFWVNLKAPTLSMVSSDRNIALLTDDIFHDRSIHGFINNHRSKTCHKDSETKDFHDSF